MNPVWLAATTGLAATAVAVMILPVPGGRSLTLLPEQAGGALARGAVPPAASPAGRQVPRQTAPSSGGTADSGLPAATGVAATAAATPVPAPRTVTVRAVRPPAPRPEREPAAPRDVTAAAVSPQSIQVAWTAPPGATGFRVASGCPAGGCGDAGAPLAVPGQVTAVTVAVTPGASQCFQVRALRGGRASDWSPPACATTPGVVVTGSQQWTDSGVTLRSGDQVTITAAGLLTAAGEAVPPAGDPACAPAAGGPGTPVAFPWPELPCWSLVARIGSGPVFGAGTPAALTATAGRLYLGVNEPAGAVTAGGWTVSIARSAAG